VKLFGRLDMIALPLQIVLDQPLLLPVELHREPRQNRGGNEHGNQK